MHLSICSFIRLSIHYYLELDLYVSEYVSVSLYIDKKHEQIFFM